MNRDRNEKTNVVPASSKSSETAHDGMTRIIRKSLLTGKVHSMDLPVNPLDLDAYHAGTANIQDVFPHLNDEQREFIKTGITPEEWAFYVRLGGDCDESEDPSE